MKNESVARPAAQAAARSGGAGHRWLARIPEVFSHLADDILTQLGAVGHRRPGRDYHLISVTDPDIFRAAEAGLFVQWNLPVQHAWPCCPERMEGFIEKAAQALQRKFGPRNPQSILAGPFDAGSPNKYYRSLASNLRGRVLQLFPPLRAATAEEQDPAEASLYLLVGNEGLFAGMQSPRAANGFYAGGTKFISHGAAGSISRAGAKIAEALHYLQLYQSPPAAGSHWLELGASPGGMTAELLAREYRVTAVDRAPLDRRLAGRHGLTFVGADARAWQPPAGTPYDALLSDLNGDARDSIRLVSGFSRFLKARALVVFTLKTPGAETAGEILTLFRGVVAQAAAAGLRLIARTHLTYNRQEFTLFFERA